MFHFCSWACDTRRRGTHAVYTRLKFFFRSDFDKHRILLCTFRYRTILQNKTIILCISCFDAIQLVLKNASKSGRLTANIFSLTTDRNSVADLLCLSRIRVFSIPDPNYFYPGSGIRIKEFKNFNPKIVSKL